MLLSPPLCSEPRPWKLGWDLTWAGMIACGGPFLENVNPPSRQTIANGIRDLLCIWAQQETHLANGKA